MLLKSPDEKLVSLMIKNKVIKLFRVHKRLELEAVLTTRFFNNIKTQ